MPAASAMLVLAFRLTFRVPLPVIPLTVTVTLEPELADTLAMVPVALSVKPSEKSSVEMLETNSLKVTVKSTLVADAAAPPMGAVLVTDGLTLSTVALDVSATVVLPAPLVAVTLTLRLVLLIAPPTIV